MQFQTQTNFPGGLAAAPAPSVSPPVAGAEADVLLSQRIDELARKHGFSAEAVHTLWESLVLGRGGMAQFNHPEFGGSGQWMRGGMVMVGDMFNTGLSARVASACEDLAQLLDAHPELARSVPASHASDEWWPDGLSGPASSGAQNGVRYAWFPVQKRLAIERGGAVELYDTQEHLIGGVAQQQGAEGSLTFTSQSGPLRLESLPRMTVAGDALGRETVSPAVLQPGHAPAAHGSFAAVASATERSASSELPDTDHIVATIDKLADMHQRGVLTLDEFTAKKTELLKRL